MKVYNLVVATAQKTTEEIIGDLKQGRDREENARLLFQRYADWVYRYFQGKGFFPQDCEELTGDVFLSVYMKLGELRQDTKFENWMCRITVNVYRDEMGRRHAKKRTAAEVSLDEEIAHPENVGLHAAAADPETRVLEKEKLEMVEEVIEALPQQMQRCLLLHVVDGLTYEEIATVLNISPNTVSVHLHQARKVLKEKLGPYSRRF